MNYKFVGSTRTDVTCVKLEEAVKYCNERERLTLDIETSYKFGGQYDGEGLVPQLSTICMFQIGDENTQFIIDARIIDCSVFKGILEDDGIEIIGHNIKFEYKHILYNYGIRISHMYDTQLAEQITHLGAKYIKLRFSLAALIEKYLGKVVDKSTRLEFSKIGDTPFTKRQIEYGAEDVLHPTLIYNLQKAVIRDKQVGSCVRLENKFVAVLGDIELKGMHFNKEIWEKTYHKNLTLFNAHKKVLDDFVIDNYGGSPFIVKQLDLFSTDVLVDIKWTSSKQVISFFNYLGICPKEVSKTTKKLAYTVNANIVRASLNTMNSEVTPEVKQFILDYLKLKEYEQCITTFGIAFFKYINPVTGRLHSNYRQILNTGRISSSNPNLQNIPSLDGFRSAFDCPEGTKIVNADYTGQEQIILANKSGDADLKYFYEAGLGDMHSFVASKIYPEIGHLSLSDIKRLHPDKRQIAKNAGFAINYGGTGYTISKNLGIPTVQGDAVYDAYFKAFPGLKNYFSKVQKLALQRGYILIDPVTGRKNWFNRPKTPKDRGKIERAALNYPIQGEAGGITKYAPILFRDWILENNYQDRVFITNIVHDEINVECDENLSTEVASNLERCMKQAGDLWCKTIPLGADAVITTYWTH